MNIVLIERTVGPMAQGNWSVGLYFDERANQQQSQALQAIFTGADGGPISALAPLISTVLGDKAVPINFQKVGKRRSVEIPNIMQLAVHAIPSLNPDQDI